MKLGETPEMPGKDEAGRLSAQKDNVDQSPNDLFRITVSVFSRHFVAIDYKRLT